MGEGGGGKYMCQRKWEEGRKAGGINREQGKSEPRKGGERDGWGKASQSAMMVGRVSQAAGRFCIFLNRPATQLLGT